MAVDNHTGREGASLSRFSCSPTPPLPHAEAACECSSLRPFTLTRLQQGILLESSWVIELNLCQGTKKGSAEIKQCRIPGGLA